MGFQNSLFSWSSSSHEIKTHENFYHVYSSTYVLKLFNMALFRYLRPVGDECQAPHSQSVPRAVLAEVNKEVRSAEKRGGKRGSYLSLSIEEKAQVAKYAGIHGVRAAIKHFSKVFSKDLKENTVRDWVKTYKKELQRKRSATEIGDELEVTQLPCKKRGRPYLLREAMDAEVQVIIRSMRDGGAVVNTSIAIAVATGVARKRDRSLLKDNGGHLELTKSWGKSLLHRMGFVKRKGNTKCKVPVECFEALKSQFLEDIKATIEMQDIPPELVINWDQTGIKLVPVSSWTMEQRGSQRVEISGIDDKRQITAVFAATAIGDFLPPQVIYKGKSSKSLPSTTFPADWSITFTPNRWSNEETMKVYIEEIIAPYVRQTRERLSLSEDHPALAIFDVFKGQCTEDVLQLLEDNNIEHVQVPPNCTDRLQPLDLSVNKPAKDFLRSRFQEWYADQIFDQLDGEEAQQQPVDMRLSIMKPLGAKWLISLYDYLCRNPSIIVNGFIKSGISSVL